MFWSTVFQWFDTLLCRRYGTLWHDMKLFGKLFDIDYAVLPIGDNYTMGPKDAILAAKFLKAKKLFRPL